MKVKTKSDSAGIISIREYLAWMAKNIGSVTRQNINGYTCFEDFVLKHGQQFGKRGRLPKWARMGKEKHCYENAAKLVLRHPNLIYVEGYAAGIIPVMHAWCVTRKGEVIDPTWRDGLDYYGVPIKTTYLLDSIELYGVYGVIDLWQDRWPILKEDPSVFKETINQTKI